MLVLVGPGVSANAIAINEDVGVHTKMPLNVRTRVVSLTGIAEMNGVSRNQAQTPARKRVTRRPHRRARDLNSLFAYFKFPVRSSQIPCYFGTGNCHLTI